jgi:hypothetical protein
MINVLTGESGACRHDPGVSAFHVPATTLDFDVCAAMFPILMCTCVSPISACVLAIEGEFSAPRPGLAAQLPTVAMYDNAGSTPSTT